jgi:hypothetical protein
VLLESRWATGGAAAAALVLWVPKSAGNRLTGSNLLSISCPARGPRFAAAVASTGLLVADYPTEPAGYAWVTARRGPGARRAGGGR